MDISGLETKRAAEEGRLMVLKHPADGKELRNDDDSPVGVRLAGIDSDLARRFEREWRDRVLSDQLAIAAGEREPADPPDFAFEKAVAITMEFEGIELDGKTLRATAGAVRDFYTRFPHWMDQALSFHSQRQHYLGNSSGASSTTAGGSSASRLRSGKAEQA